MAWQTHGIASHGKKLGLRCLMGALRIPMRLFIWSIAQTTSGNLELFINGRELVTTSELSYR